MLDRMKIVIAEQHEIVRDAIAARLVESCDVDVVAQASDGYSTIRACRQHKPEVLMMNLSLVRPSGLETLKKLRSGSPDLKVIIFSADTMIRNVVFALSQGAVSFLPVQAKSSDYVKAVQAAQAGFVYLPVGLMKDILHSRQNLIRTGSVFGLSPRETEILDACVGGQSTKQVAESLSISVRTVETHRNSIYRKTSCSNFKELATIYTPELQS